MSPARLKGAARRCATGLRPALTRAVPSRTRQQPGPGETYATLRARRRCPARAAANACHRLTQPGSTDKQGSAWLRWVLNQAAQTAKRSPQFAATYAAIAKRRGKKIATIAIARKLLTRA